MDNRLTYKFLREQRRHIDNVSKYNIDEWTVVRTVILKYIGREIGVNQYR